MSAWELLTILAAIAALAVTINRAMDQPRHRRAPIIIILLAIVWTATTTDLFTTSLLLGTHPYWYGLAIFEAIYTTIALIPK